MIDEAGRGLAAELIQRVALLDPRRSEDRDAFLDIPQRSEATLDLVMDALETQLVLLLDVAGRPQQQLVALRADALVL